MSDIDRFLNKIGEIESHNGKYTNHKKITSGLHEGFSAIGKYGLMPLTVQEVAHNSQDPEIHSLSKRDPQEYNDLINSNPDLEKKIASELAHKVLTRQGGDELKAAYSWNQGHNLSPEQITDERLLESPYVHKYFQLAGNTQQNNAIPTENVSMNPETSIPQTSQETPTLDKLLETYKQLQNQNEPKEIELRKNLEETEPQEENSEEDPRVAALEKMR